MKIEVPDDLFAEVLKQILLDKQVVREALTKALSAAKVVDQLAVRLAANISEATTKIVEGSEFSDCIQAAAVEAVEQAVARATVKAGEDYIRDRFTEEKIK